MKSHVKFGPENDEWIYNRDTREYDLTRGQLPRGFTMKTTEGPADTTITLAPSLSALVVVDMQNFFLHPRCNEHPTGLAAVERLIEVVAKCREAGIRIIWLNWGLTEADIASMPAATSRSFASSLVTPPLDNKQQQARNGFGSDMGDGRGRLLMAGSWNAALYDPLLPLLRRDDDAAANDDDDDDDTDIFCAKNRISGLWNDETPLARALAGEGVGEEEHGHGHGHSGGGGGGGGGSRSRFRTLLFAGVNTDQCVLGTLADAYYRGYDCVLVEDCCATKTPGGQEVTVLNTSRGFGFVVDSKSFCEGKVTK
ncbi:isochorismatase [Xylariaceae sp. FL0804]|nr:isochorismatase [Xylariaceae sp. FL0804]